MEGVENSVLVDISIPDSPGASDYYTSITNSLDDMSNEENTCKTGNLLNLSDESDLICNKQFMETNNVINKNCDDEMNLTLPKVDIEVPEFTKNIINVPQNINNLFENTNDMCANNIVDDFTDDWSLKFFTENNLKLLEDFENINFENVKLLEDEEFDFDMTHFSPKTIIRKKRESAIFRMSMSKLSEGEMQKIFDEMKQLSLELNNKNNSNSKCDTELNKETNSVDIKPSSIEYPCFKGNEGVLSCNTLHFDVESNFETDDKELYSLNNSYLKKANAGNSYMFNTSLENKENKIVNNDDIVLGKKISSENKSKSTFVLSKTLALKPHQSPNIRISLSDALKESKNAFTRTSLSDINLDKTGEKKDSLKEQQLKSSLLPSRSINTKCARSELNICDNTMLNHNNEAFILSSKESFCGSDSNLSDNGEIGKKNISLLQKPKSSMLPRLPQPDGRLMACVAPMKKTSIEAIDMPQVSDATNSSSQSPNKMPKIKTAAMNSCQVQGDGYTGVKPKQLRMTSTALPSKFSQAVPLKANPVTMTINSRSNLGNSLDKFSSQSTEIKMPVNKPMGIGIPSITRNISMQKDSISKTVQLSNNNNEILAENIKGISMPTSKLSGLIKRSGSISRGPIKTSNVYTKEDNLSLERQSLASKKTGRDSLCKDSQNSIAGGSSLKRSVSAVSSSQPRRKL